MRDISTKVDDVDELSGDDWNSSQDELENVVESADFTLDPAGGPNTNLNMLGQTLALYAGAGVYYDDSGSANTYVLGRSLNLKNIASYKDGIVVIFKASATNTGASTVNLTSLGAKAITTDAGVALTAGQIVLDQYVTARYNSASDRFEIITARSIQGSTVANIMRTISIEIFSEAGASIQVQADTKFNSIGHVDTTQTSPGGITKGGGGETEGTGPEEVTYTLDATGSVLTIDLAETVSNIISTNLFDNSMTTPVVGSPAISGGNIALHISDLLGANFDLTGVGSGKIQIWNITYMVGGTL